MCSLGAWPRVSSSQAGLGEETKPGPAAPSTSARLRAAPARVTGHGPGSHKQDQLPRRQARAQWSASGTRPLREGHTHKNVGSRGGGGLSTRWVTGSDGPVPCFQDALLGCVQKKVPLLLSRGMVRLVVIDSVAAPFRCEFEGPASARRARALQALGAALRRLSRTFRSPVLCVNQVGPSPAPSFHERVLCL